MKKSGFNYRLEDGHYLIELKLDSVQQLFNLLDPAPFREKDLHPAAEEYIVAAATELPHDAPLKLRLYLPPDSCDGDEVQKVPAAVHHYFSYRASVTARQFMRTLRLGRKALVIGATFLVFCILAQQLIASLGRSGLLWLIIEEGFLISGWVAMWRPIEIFLYEWWPIRREQRLFEKLAQIPVEIVPTRGR